MERIDSPHKSSEPFCICFEPGPTGLPQGKPANLNAVITGDNVSHGLSSGGFGCFGPRITDTLDSRLQVIEQLLVSGAALLVVILEP